MSQHVLGVYWAPGHMRQSDMDYMAHLQPPAIRILEPDSSLMTRAHLLAGRALLLPRDWALSEQHDDVRRDPVGTGIRHAQDWRGKINAWRAAGMNVPDEQIVVVGINEPKVWEMRDEAIAYNVAFLDECTKQRLRACALNLSVGWPANTGHDTPPDWTPYEPVRDAIRRGRHFLCVHEYWYHSGPQDGALWWAWRINRCPWDVPIIIGEAGIDNYVDDNRWNNEGKPPRGWHGNVTPRAYAEMILRYARGLDKRVVAILPFLTDYRAREWQSFDTADAHADLLALASTMVPQSQPPQQHTVHLPVITAPTEPQPQPNNDWTRARAFVARWEGGFVNNPADPGGATNMGITISTLKAWRASKGMPAPTVEDVRNLTTAEADAIYHAWYWQASGADKLPWPLSLIVFDTAVLHGTAIARQWHSETRGNATDYLAKRLASYTRMGHWQHFGAGWVRRVADLLDMLA